MSTVSFTVKDQSVREHMISVHGHSNHMYNALSEKTLVEVHDQNHTDGNNQMIEHTHE